MRVGTGVIALGCVQIKFSRKESTMTVARGAGDNKGASPLLSSWGVFLSEVGSGFWLETVSLLAAGALLFGFGFDAQRRWRRRRGGRHQRVSLPEKPASALRNGLFLSIFLFAVTRPLLLLKSSFPDFFATGGQGWLYGLSFPLELLINPKASLQGIAAKIMAGGFTGIIASHFGFSILLLLLSTSVFPFLEAMQVGSKDVNKSTPGNSPPSDGEANEEGSDHDAFTPLEKVRFAMFDPSKFQVLSVLGYGATCIVPLVRTQKGISLDGTNICDEETIVFAQERTAQSTHNARRSKSEDECDVPGAAVQVSLSENLAASRSLPSDLNLLSDGPLVAAKSTENLVRWMDAEECTRESVNVGEPLARRCSSSSSSLSSMMHSNAGTDAEDANFGEGGRMLAIKVMSKTRTKKAGLKRSVQREREALAACNSEFICAMHGAFQDDRWLYLILEPVGAGDLASLLASRVVMFEEEARFYVACVLLALEHLHAHGFACLDVKPENLFLDQWGYVKLGDLGVAKDVRGFTGGDKWEFVGTPEYMSCEVVTGQLRARGIAGVAGPDLWAVGILIFELLVGETPFASSSADDTLRMISGLAQSERRRRRVESRFFSRREDTDSSDSSSRNRNILFPDRSASDTAQDLVQRLVCPEPTLRLGCRLCKNENDMGASGVMKHSWFSGWDWDALRGRKLRAPFVPHPQTLAEPFRPRTLSGPSMMRAMDVTGAPAMSLREMMAALETQLEIASGRGSGAIHFRGFKPFAHARPRPKRGVDTEKLKNRLNLLLRLC